MGLHHEGEGISLRAPNLADGRSVTISATKRACYYTNIAMIAYSRNLARRYQTIGRVLKRVKLALLLGLCCPHTHQHHLEEKNRSEKRRRTSANKRSRLLVQIYLSPRLGDVNYNVFFIVISLLMANGNLFAMGQQSLCTGNG